jgi:hypothetical protein
MNNNVMNAKDAVSASLAECFVTIEGNRYNFMQAINLKQPLKRIRLKFPSLGNLARGTKQLVGLEQVMQPSIITPVFSGNCCIGTRTLVRIFILTSR